MGQCFIATGESGHSRPHTLHPVHPDAHVASEMIMVHLSMTSSGEVLNTKLVTWSSSFQPVVPSHLVIPLAVFVSRLSRVYSPHRSVVPFGAAQSAPGCVLCQPLSGFNHPSVLCLDSPWKVYLSEVDPAVTRISVGGLTPARTFQFRLCAVNQVGRGQYSAETQR